MKPSNDYLKQSTQTTHNPIKTESQSSTTKNNDGELSSVRLLLQYVCLTIIGANWKYKLKNIKT